MVWEFYIVNSLLAVPDLNSCTLVVVKCITRTCPIIQIFVVTVIDALFGNFLANEPANDTILIVKFDRSMLLFSMNISDVAQKGNFSLICTVLRKIVLALLSFYR